MFQEYAWLIPALPFAAFLLILLMRGLPKNGAELAIPAVGLSAVWAVGVLLETHLGTPHEMGFTWMHIGDHRFTMGLYIDNLSALMAALVGFLSLLIVIYSPAYLKEEGEKRIRYFAQICLFVSGMLGTVLADNYLLMFVAWEIMGLCSYLLIGFWFQKPSAASAAKKAFLVTRVGDVSLLLGLLILYVVFGTFSYREIFGNPQLAEANSDLIFIAALAIFGGAVGKSAQFPLHVWLPDAMEGPTTVSALIHAATMVKAGVFLVARSFPLFLIVPDVFPYIALAGGITAFIAATMALVQFDIKRVLAYSTLSQLGYMFLALGAGGIIASHEGLPTGYVGGLYHLMNHAFFKALLFLGAGSVIVGMHHHNDMRQMGGLRKHMPLTAYTMLIGTLSIAGLPPFSGFWSKDVVLEAAQEASHFNILLLVLWLLALTVALLTPIYMFRMWLLTFTGTPRSDMAEHAHESPKSMTVPLAILALFPIIGGAFLVFDFGEFVTEDVIGQPFEFVGGHEMLTHILGSPFTYLSVILAALGTLVAISIYVFHKPHPDQLTVPIVAHDAHKVLVNLYYYDTAFMKTGEAIGMGLARASDAVDRNLVDGAVRSVGWLSRTFGQGARRLQTGVVTTYAVTVIVGLGFVLVALVGGWP